MALDGDEDDDDDDCRALRSAKNQGGTFHIKQKAKQIGRGGMIEASIGHSSFSMRGRGLMTEQRNANNLNQDTTPEGN